LPQGTTYLGEQVPECLGEKKTRNKFCHNQMISKCRYLKLLIKGYGKKKVKGQFSSLVASKET
jgi:hypothetical protein